MLYLNAFIDAVNQPAEESAVEIFGEGISGIVGLSINNNKQSLWASAVHEAAMLNGQGS